MNPFISSSKLSHSTQSTWNVQRIPEVLQLKEIRLDVNDIENNTCKKTKIGLIIFQRILLVTVMVILGQKCNLLSDVQLKTGPERNLIFFNLEGL